MYDSPPDGGSMYDSPPDGGSLYNSPIDGGPMSSHKSSCVYSFVYTEPLHKDFYYEYPFRVFHSCLQMFIGSEMHLKCQNFRNVSCLECIIPVVDRKTKIIYANRFCAECNAIEDIETFNHEFKCSSEILGRWDLLSLEQTEENNIVLFHAEEVAVSKFDWYDYKWSNRYLEDGEYCALCDYPSAMPEYPDFGQSESNTVQGACNYRECQTFRFQFMSHSFFILMSLDKALPTKGDDRVLTPSDLTCGNQPYVIYDKYMVRNIPFFDLYLNNCFL